MVKNLPAVQEMDSIPESGRSSGEEMATHFSILAWKIPFTEEPNGLLLLEKEMATHSRVLALRIPATGEPGGLPSMGSHRVGHD